jgi:hypothetical protein
MIERLFRPVSDFAQTWMSARRKLAASSLCPRGCASFVGEIPQEWRTLLGSRSRLQRFSAKPVNIELVRWLSFI